jgi:hypothetical protein
MGVKMLKSTAQNPMQVDDGANLFGEGKGERDGAEAQHEAEVDSQPAKKQKL